MSLRPLTTLSSLMLVAVIVSPLAAQSAAPEMIVACYDARTTSTGTPLGSGIVYRIKAPGVVAQQGCLLPSHAQMQWVNLAGQSCPQGRFIAGIDPAGALICGAPATAEMCDGIDNNLNGQTDEGFPYCVGGRAAVNTNGSDCVSGFADRDSNRSDGCEYTLQSIALMRFLVGGVGGTPFEILIMTVGEQREVVGEITVRGGPGLVGLSYTWSLDQCFGISEMRPTASTLLITARAPGQCAARLTAVTSDLPNLPTTGQFFLIVQPASEP